jgi:hypothetical protein
MIPPLPTAQPSVAVVMKTEFNPPADEETLFHPPPNPAVPDQFQKAPETESTAQASVALRAKTDDSFCASGAERPAEAGNHEKPPQKSATAVPPLPPTAKPEFRFGAPGGPNETPKRSEVVPEAIRVHDVPSKCSIVPAFPTAQPLLELKMTTPFKLSVADAGWVMCAADLGSASSRITLTKSKPRDIERMFLRNTYSQWDRVMHVNGF